MTLTETVAGTDAVARQLVDYCRALDFEAAVKALYAPEIVSIEAVGSPECPREIQGLDAVLQKQQGWSEHHTIHSISVSEPLVAGPFFSVQMTLDVTFKPAGQRFPMAELAVYEVRDGKIVREQFFYDM